MSAARVCAAVAVKAGQMVVAHWTAQVWAKTLEPSQLFVQFVSRAVRVRAGFGGFDRLLVPMRDCEAPRDAIEFREDVPPLFTASSNLHGIVYTNIIHDTV